jgi:rhodanese-related sulfurtransferase
LRGNLTGVVCRVFAEGRLEASMVHELSMEEIAEGLGAGSIVLVDVREAHEFAMGHIPGSVSMPLSQFDPAVMTIPDGRRIVFSCAAGVRSLRALYLARAAGVDVDAHYLGGFKDWMISGGTVARG